METTNKCNEPKEGNDLTAEARQNAELQKSSFFRRPRVTFKGPDKYGVVQAFVPAEIIDSGISVDDSLILELAEQHVQLEMYRLDTEELQKELESRQQVVEIQQKVINQLAEGQRTNQEAEK